MYLTKADKEIISGLDNLIIRCKESLKKQEEKKANLPFNYIGKSKKACDCEKAKNKLAKTVKKVVARPVKKKKGK